MFKKLDDVILRFERLTEKLSDPQLYNDSEQLKKVTEERSSLEEIVRVYQSYKEHIKSLEEAKDILREEKDPELREMASLDVSLAQDKLPLLEQELKVLLLPKDPLDSRNVMIEIRAGAGGDEASLFVAEVYRMYQNYLKSLGYRLELISLSEGDQGIKEIIFSVAGERAYSRLKYESGVHRVQRVPKTESQGRVHTSTITVAVIPEAEEIDFQLNMNEVRVEVFRASGSGGQSVNTTDSAVRVTHVPTGMSVMNQDQKSQIKNKEKALKILRNRIFDQMLAKQQQEEALNRRGQVGTGDRSERIRTYNFPQGRLTDHRIGLTLYNLSSVMEGELSEVIDAVISYYNALALKGQEEIV